MEHGIIKSVDGYSCETCGRRWKQKPRYGCPGVRWYERRTAPEHLTTLGQLKKRGLKPNAPRRAVVGGMGQRDLFNVAETIPFTAEELAAQKELARHACILGMDWRMEQLFWIIQMAVASAGRLHRQGRLSCNSGINQDDGIF